MDLLLCKPASLFIVLSFNSGDGTGLTHYIWSRSSWVECQGMAPVFLSQRRWPMWRFALCCNKDVRGSDLSVFMATINPSYKLFSELSIFHLFATSGNTCLKALFTEVRRTQ